MSYQERALAIIDRLTDSKAINNRERGTLRRAILLEPERPKGEWLPLLDTNENGEPYQVGVYCDKCGYKGIDTSNFCPNCGADMRGGAE